MKKIRELLGRSTLVKNSIYLMLSNGILAAGGFLFWIFIARLYPATEIGIATSLISVISLIASLALFGLNTGIMKFLPASNDKNKLISSVVSLVSLTAFTISIIALAAIPLFSKPLAFAASSPYYAAAITIFTVFTALNLLSETILIAYRSSKYVLFKNIVLGSVKLMLPYLLIGLAGFGILASYFTGNIVAVFIAFYVLYKKHALSYVFKISKTMIKSMSAVSVGTYISTLMISAPLYVIPIIITNVLGPAQTAFYYMVTTTTNVMNLVPLVISQNFMVEGSYDTGKIQHLLRRSIQLSLAILIPFIIFILLFGNYILLVFGKEYSSEGINLLYLLAAGSVLVGFNYMLMTLLIIYSRIKYLVICNGLYAVILFALTYYLIGIGIIGAGYATLLAQAALMLFYIFAIFKINKLSLLASLLKFKV